MKKFLKKLELFKAMPDGLHLAGSWNAARRIQDMGSQTEAMEALLKAMAEKNKAMENVLIGISTFHSDC